MMEHKGYLAHTEFDDEGNVFHGEVVNVRDVITFQGKTVEELRRAFQDSVEDYLTFCADRGEEPERPFAGRFTVRLSPEQHRRVVLAAEKAGKGIEKWMTKVVTQAAGSGTEGKSRKLSSQPLQPMRQTARRSS
ncbi:MAG: antitoxin HicB [Armatimonadetes bacterium CG2_30_59_28]|nr:MAG: antitoxin HicB [Armatimonadetes bacterium CG2_30_59_28]PIU64432.1 MAG: toxin-antitoxin system HicB family antitoxin [Armatimonadetes bacterium CG07_land_8_20_14_0_80_59_28]PIY41011.1 MAG: toxin-antitoxin system HicB family antitoxin [Armatimonadetes bacterium CG_4_10_14_3_um_filter_59_10]PJB64662.1 MAG: toxin-antitoxin system HicB family antitoxin [Armatimonadetes bacterium CG_4_9_14_3_um_filter_58_7]